VAVIKSYGAFEIKPIMSDAILRPIAPVYVNTKINMIRIPAGKKSQLTWLFKLKSLVKSSLK
jgi:hypothetical protein